MGQDSVQTYVTTNEDGVATSVGIAFPAKAMDGIPANQIDGTFLLPFPTGAPALGRAQCFGARPQPLDRRRRHDK